MIMSDRKNKKVIYNPALDKYENVILFKEKVESAKAMLAKVGIPEKWRIQLDAK
jgi:hypothetical protein